MNFASRPWPVFSTTAATGGWRSEMRQNAVQSWQFAGSGAKVAAHFAEPECYGQVSKPSANSASSKSGICASMLLLESTGSVTVSLAVAFTTIGFGPA